MKTGPKFPVIYRGNQESSAKFQSNNETDLNIKGKHFKTL